MIKGQMRKLFRYVLLFTNWLYSGIKFCFMFHGIIVLWLEVFLSLIYPLFLLKMRKVRIKGVRQVVQGSKESCWWKQSRNGNFLTLSPQLFSWYHSVGEHQSQSITIQAYHIYYINHWLPAFTTCFISVSIFNISSHVQPGCNVFCLVGFDDDR